MWITDVVAKVKGTGAAVDALPQSARSCAPQLPAPRSQLPAIRRPPRAWKVPRRRSGRGIARHTGLSRRGPRPQGQDGRAEGLRPRLERRDRPRQGSGRQRRRACACSRSRTTASSTTSAPTSAPAAPVPTATPGVPPQCGRDRRVRCGRWGTRAVLACSHRRRWALGELRLPCCTRGGGGGCMVVGGCIIVSPYFGLYQRPN